MNPLLTLNDTVYSWYLLHFLVGYYTYHRLLTGSSSTRMASTSSS